jgi:hypothetical protein
MSDTHCAVCERRIVSSGDGATWWHWPDFTRDGDNGLDQHAKKPRPHKAAPPQGLANDR